TPRPPRLPYTTLFRSLARVSAGVPGGHALRRQFGLAVARGHAEDELWRRAGLDVQQRLGDGLVELRGLVGRTRQVARRFRVRHRSEEHTSELQSRENL